MTKAMDEYPNGDNTQPSLGEIVQAAEDAGYSAIGHWESTSWTVVHVPPAKEPKATEEQLRQLQERFDNLRAGND